VAKELGSRGVRCNALAPGFIRTDMTDSLTEAQVDGLIGQIPLGRLGEVDDIAGVALFLVSPAACYITGQVLAVDGGMVM
jgi:3-oxoacyl-[acyl-carrier protein] reductase